MPYFSIQTAGPGFTEEHESIEAAADWVQRYLPLKRGWTVSHVMSERNGTSYLHVLVHNSRGRVVNGAWVRPATPADMRLVH